jgi:hypothetical protein
MSLPAAPNMGDMMKRSRKVNLVQEIVRLCSFKFLPTEDREWHSQTVK